MTESSTEPRRVVTLTFEVTVNEDGTPMWHDGHPEEVVAREFGGTGVQVVLGETVTPRD